MAVQFTEKAMRERLVKNRAEDAAISEQTKGLREERDNLVTDIQPTENRIRELNKQIAKIEQPRFDLAMEHSLLVKSLPGNRTVPAVDAQVVNQDLVDRRPVVKKKA